MKTNPLKLMALLAPALVSLAAQAEKSCTVVNYIGTNGYTLVEQDDSAGELWITQILLRDKSLAEITQYLGSEPNACSRMIPLNPAHRHPCNIKYVEETDQYMIAQGSYRKSPELSKDEAIQVRNTLEALGVCL